MDRFTTGSLLLPRELALTLLDQAKQESALTLGPKGSATIAATLQELAQAAFFASLSNEEGTPALARIALGDDAPSVVRFASPYPLSVDLLRRLSPAMSAPGLAISISHELRAIGLSGGPPSALGVFAERPGRLVVSYKTLVLAIFEGGEWIPVGRGSKPAQTQLFTMLMHKSARPLRRILSFARRHRRGAMFVLCESRRPSEALVTPPLLALEPLPPPDVKPTADQIRDWGHDTNTQIVTAHWHFRSYEERVALRLNATASAAGMDGATLLGPDYEPIGFGAKIRATATNMKVALWNWKLGRSESVPLGSIGGMRHQSAVALVQNDPDMLVYVVSQDGTISVIGAPNSPDVTGDVVVVRHLDRLLEAEWAFRTPEL